jgi:hypothetical protein
MAFRLGTGTSTQHLTLHSRQPQRGKNAIGLLLRIQQLRKLRPTYYGRFDSMTSGFFCNWATTWRTEPGNTEDSPERYNPSSKPARKCNWGNKLRLLASDLKGARGARGDREVKSSSSSSPDPSRLPSPYPVYPVQTVPGIPKPDGIGNRGAIQIRLIRSVYCPPPLLQGFFREFRQLSRQLSSGDAVDGLCRLGHQVLLVHESFFPFVVCVFVPLSRLAQSVGLTASFEDCVRSLIRRRPSSHVA